MALWNKAVSLKSAAAVSLDLNAQCKFYTHLRRIQMIILVSIVRLVASTVVLLCSPNDISEHVIKKHITVSHSHCVPHSI